MPDADVQKFLRDADAIVKRMRLLPPKILKKCLGQATRKAMKPVLKTAQGNAARLDDPNTGESIAKNVAIKISTKKGKFEGGTVMSVGVRGGAKQYTNNAENRRGGRAGKSYKTLGSSANPGGDTLYWRLLELGTSRFQGRHFMLPALQNNIGNVTNILANEISRFLDKEAGK